MSHFLQRFLKNSRGLMREIDQLVTPLPCRSTSPSQLEKSETEMDLSDLQPTNSCAALLPKAFNNCQSTPFYPFQKQAER